MTFPARFLIALSALAVFAGTPAFAADAAQETRPGGENAVEKQKPFSYGQLRGRLMDFADAYMQMIGQAADTLKKTNDDPGVRTSILSSKLFPCSAAFMIATDANPQRALLDMVVLVHLQGSVWKETLPKRYGENAVGFLEAQARLEENIDDIAERALGRERLGRLKALVEEWRVENPDQRYVSYIRITDFASDGRRGRRPGRSSNPLSIGGLLSAFQLVNMDETTRSVDQARMLGERALYLSVRMPTLIRWQTEMLFYELASTPEAKSLSAAAEALNSLPALVAAERKAAIEQAAAESERRGRAIVWEAAKACIAVAFAVFALALAYRFLVTKIDPRR